ncbi:MAG TPA: lantibiotic dehydratase [Puia sp.]|nr:lantibiotic dehydratase [Puia sp.]
MLRTDNYYVLRTPTLAIDWLLEETKGLTMDSLAEFVRKTYHDQELGETLYLASTELYQQYEKWLKGELDKRQEQKLLQTLYKYLLRMATRATPFGLFAGCAGGVIGDATKIVVSTREKVHIHRRLDMNYVEELAEMFVANKAIGDKLRFYPNSSIYRIHDQYRYVAYELTNRVRSYRVVSVQHSSYLEDLIAIANKGILRLELVAHLCANDIEKEEAEAFIQELIDSQLLLSELEPTVTGEEFFTVLRRIVTATGAAHEQAEMLLEIEMLLSAGQRGVIGYERVLQLIERLGVAAQKKDLVQADLFFRHPANRLSERIVAQVSKEIELLYAFFPYTPLSDLEDFKQDYVGKYEQREMPLAQVLDAGLGIGYGSFRNTGDSDYAPLLEGIGWKSRNGLQTTGVTEFGQLRIKKYTEALQNGLREVLITAEEIATLAKNNSLRIPESLFVIGDLIGNGGASMDEGAFSFVLKGCMGPSAANLTARFCHGDESILAMVKGSLAREREVQPDKVFAEVVHLPSARTGNILMRPLLRDHEIPYLCRPGVAAECTIPIDDLLISIRNSRIILRSARMDKEIVPRLTTAHAFNGTNLMIYKFLCDLQFQDVNIGVLWSWGIFDNEIFLPRVKVGHIVISKACWNLDKAIYDRMEGKGEDQMAFIKRIQRQCAIPDHVLLVQGDNELFVDLSNEVSVKILFDEWRKKGRIRLAEFFPEPENCFITDVSGRKYINEVVFPFHRAVNDAVAYRAGAQAPFRIKRIFPPGSHWFYVKLYTGTATSDRILAECILPVAEKLLAEKAIDKWFYIRYFDPKPHIRLRFHNDKLPDFWKMVLDELNLAIGEFLNKEIVFSMQIDTYQRELERYGADNMEAAESMFFHDSMAIARFLQLVDGEETEVLRWLFAAKNIDRLLYDAGLRLEGKYALIKEMRDNFFAEFGGDTSLNQDLNDRYRKHSKALQEAIGGSVDESRQSQFDLMDELLSKRSAGWKDLFAVGRLQEALFLRQLVPSYIHMSLNRLFISNQRKHELVIYHYLFKFYGSQIAIAKVNQL